jgi:hypothetical protein
MQRPAVSSERAERGRDLARRVAAWIVPEGNPGGVVYGVITVGALLAAEGALHDTYTEAVGSVALAMMLYGLAHAYSDLLGRRLAEKERLRREAPLTVVLNSISVLRGASLPFLTLLVGWALGTPLETTVTASIWIAIASLIGLEVAAGVRSHATAFELGLDAVVGVTMGLLILALKALVG